jgi:hypothetical protein
MLDANIMVAMVINNHTRPILRARVFAVFIELRVRIDKTCLKIALKPCTGLAMKSSKDL